MATDPEAFIREVDEDLRHDRLTAFWRRYGTLVIAAAVAVVVATAGWSGWRYLDERRQQRDALAFARALGGGGVRVRDPAGLRGGLDAEDDVALIGAGREGEQGEQAGERSGGTYRHERSP